MDKKVCTGQIVGGDGIKIERCTGCDVKSGVLRAKVGCKEGTVAFR